MNNQATKISLALCAALLLVAAGCGSKPAGTGTAGTTGTTALKVTDVSLGKSIGSDKAISERTVSFRPTDTIYASISTEGTALSGTLRAKWTFEDGQTVDDSSRTLVPTGPERTEFHISKPGGWPAGKYKVEVYLNDQPASAKSFEVKAS
jgi:hypothetical protein